MKIPPSDLDGARAEVMQWLIRDPGRALREARALLQQASPTLRDHGLNLRLLAHALRASGRLEESVQNYANAHAVLESIDPCAAARTTIGWVQALAMLGRLDEAADLVRRVRPRLRRDDNLAVARLDTNLANAWLHAGNAKAAGPLYRRAYRVFEAAGCKEESAHAAFGMARAHLRRGDRPRSREWLGRSRAALGSDPPPVLGTYVDATAAILDVLEGARGRGLDTLVNLGLRLDHFEDRRAAVEVQLYLTTLLLGLGCVGAARRSADECLQRATEIGSRFDAARSALLAARACEEQGNALDVTHYLSMAEEMGPKDALLWRSRLRLLQARVDMSSGRVGGIHAELARLQGKLDRLDPSATAVLCRRIRAEAWLVAGRPAVAARLLRRARRQAAASHARGSLPRLALLLARCAEARGDSRSAVRWAERSVTELESELMEWHISSLRSEGAEARDVVHGEAADIVLRNARRRRVERALEVVVRSRSPRLIEDLLEHLPAAERENARRLHDEILQRHQEDEEGFDSTTRSRSAVMTSMEKKSRFGPGPGFGPRSPQVVRRAWRLRRTENWRGRLGSRTLVLFHRSATQWRAFIVPARGPVRSVALDELSETLKRVWRPLRLIFETAARLTRDRREEFLDRTHEEAEHSLTCLRQAIVTPLDLDASRVILIPDDQLHDLPLEAIFGMQSQIVEVSRLPHPALLRSSRPRRKPTALLLHGSSPGQEAEVRALGRRFRKSGFTVHTSQRRRALASHTEGVGALHLAAHGVFHRRDHHLSSIHLGDGPMGFDHLRSRSLRGALIVFSSCESGLAARRAGRDLDGWITSGFAQGVREMVLTLWKIDDSASRSFAASFYDHWLKGRSAGESAVHAAREARRRGEHPYRWAAHFAAG